MRSVAKDPCEVCTKEQAETLPVDFDGIHQVCPRCGEFKLSGTAGSILRRGVSEQLITDLARYRLFYGLSAMPSALENTPLVMSVAGRTDKFLTPTAVYLVVKEVFPCSTVVLTLPICWVKSHLPVKDCIRNQQTRD